jgi:hypothetical protein
MKFCGILHPPNYKKSSLEVDIITLFFENPVLCTVDLYEDTKRQGMSMLIVLGLEG